MFRFPSVKGSGKFMTGRRHTLTRGFCALLSLSVLIPLLLLSCGSGRDPDAGTSVLDGIASYYESLSENEKDKKTEYVIVLPAGCGADLVGCAAFLSQELAKNVGYEVPVKYDVDYARISGVCEILVGQTGREESAEFHKGLRADDYGYGKIGNSILVGAHKSTAYRFAAELLLRGIDSGNVLLADATVNRDEIVRGNYSPEKVILNGFELSEYVIVYPDEAQMAEYEIASILRDEIIAAVGYCLPLVSESACSESTRGICIGRTSFADVSVLSCEEERSYICSDGRNITLLSGESYGILNSARLLCKMMCGDGGDGVQTLEIGDTVTDEYINSEITVVSYISDDAETTLSSCTAMINGITLNDASAAFFGCIGTLAEREIFNNVYGLYDSVAMSRGDGSAMYCRKSDIVCERAEIDISHGGTVLTALLRRSSDSMKFMCVFAYTDDGASATEESEFASYLASECADPGLPLMVFHNFTAQTDIAFANAADGLEKAQLVSSGQSRSGEFSGIYISRGRFISTRYDSFAVNEEKGTFGNVITFKFCY